MSTRFLKGEINVVHIPQFKLAYIRNTTHYSLFFVKLCREVHYVWWGNQDLEQQEWEDCIKSNKKIILDIIMLVPNKNQQGYKEHVI